MLQIAICDDEPIMLQSLLQQTQDCFTKQQIFTRIHTFSEGEHLLYEIEDGRHFDLALLDIEMPRMDGMELASRIRKKLPDILIIFVTSHLEYALDAFELSVFRYVPKQNPDNRLQNALIDAAKLIQIQYTQSYIINNQQRLERIPMKNIVTITHENKNALITVLSGEVYRVRKTLQQILKELPCDEFLLIDRGCILNLTHIASIREGSVILKNGLSYPVSPSHMTKLKTKVNYFWGTHV